jgi:hypothetical protein
MRMPQLPPRPAPRFVRLPSLARWLIVASVLSSCGCSTVPVVTPQIEEAALPTIPAVLLLPASRFIPPLEASRPDGSASELEVVIAETDCRLVLDDAADQVDALAAAITAYIEAVEQREARRNAPPQRAGWVWPWQR